MKLAHRHDNRKRVQFISNVCSPSPTDGSVDDSTRFHFSAWLECEDGSLFRTVCWPGVWLKLGAPVPTCPDCGAPFEKGDEHPDMVYYHASCVDLHDPDRAS
jgi:hypothetical protein